LASLKIGKIVSPPPEYEDCLKNLFCRESMRTSRDCVFNEAYSARIIFLFTGQSTHQPSASQNSITNRQYSRH